MSEALSNNSHDKDNNSGEGNDPLEYMFDPSSSGTPSLRPPKLSEAGLQAAIQFGWSETYLPSSVTGGDRNSSVSERGNNRQSAASMSNNHSNSNNYNHHAMSGSQNQSPLFVDNYNIGLTPQQLESLLDPLRRPDLNQLPPAVLAVLLKSPRFEEIIAPRRLTENANAQQQQQRNLSEGHNSLGGGATSGSFNTSNNSANASQARAAAQRSSEIKYNPSAREFVPSSFQPSSMNQQQQKETADLAYAMSQVQFQDQHDSLQNFDEYEGPDCILSTVTDMISQVTQDPASLNRSMKTSVAVVKKHLNDEDTLGIVVTLLTEQMISNENFCYSGAKILETFHKSEVGINGKGIRPLLLTRMKEEFDHCLKNVEEIEVRVRSLGVVRLLSELYMNFGVLPNNSKLRIFGLAVLELMHKLLQTDSSPEIVRCVCQHLKLIGWEVEHANDKGIQTQFDLVLKELNLIRPSAVREDHESSVALIDMIIKLHSNDWNRKPESSSSSSSSSQTQTVIHAPAPAHTIYYEYPDSDDDLSDDDGAIMLDDEPEEVQAAYEEFLKTMNSQTKK